VNHTAPPGWRWVVLHETASTQDVVLEAARAGDPGRFAVRAITQSKGRGRGGREWVAPAGNLNLSLLLLPDFAPPMPGRYSLLAGIAVIEALVELAPALRAQLMLKWPNDLMRNGAKAGGILIDSALDGAGNFAFVVIGIGVNLRHAPPIADRLTADLVEYAIDADALSARILAKIDQYEAAEFAVTRQTWLGYAHPLGTELLVRQAGGDLRGRFAGLSANGELLLEGHVHPIASAEISLI